MISLRDIPIRRKLMVINMLTSSAALLLACTAFLGYETITFRRALSQEQSTLANVIGANSAAAVIFNDAPAAAKTLSALQAEPQVVAACIYTLDGKPFATYVRTGITGWAPPKLLNAGASIEKDHLTLFQSIVHNGERIGRIYLESDLHALRERVARYAAIIGLVLVVSLLVALLLSGQLQRLVSGPILHLVQTARNVSETEDYSARATKASGDELGLLVDSFNEMLQQIQERDVGLRQRNDALQDEIVERQLAEEKLKAFAAKLEQSNRELQDFAYVASHDLQEPLRKIQAFGDRLKAKHGETLSAEGCGYLERMQNAAHRMQMLINDLLQFSRVTTNAQPFKPVDLSQIAREVISDLEARLEQTAGRVQLGELPTIDADPLQMRQLLQNLVSNALKFHRKETPPVVQLRWQRNGESDKHCQVLVEDNGIGFDEKYLDRIFGVFQRLHGRDEYEGTGVGLAICRKIVARHGGSITAKSKPGQGATFIVTLPVHQPTNKGTNYE
jgi:signal transduction histidine kinase